MVEEYLSPSSGDDKGGNSDRWDSVKTKPTDMEGLEWFAIELWKLEASVEPASIKEAGSNPLEFPYCSRTKKCRVPP